jgi:hypothetical protein
MADSFCIATRGKMMKRLALCLLSVFFVVGTIAACSDEDTPTPPRKKDQIVIIPDSGAKQDK